MGVKVLKWSQLYEKAKKEGKGDSEAKRIATESSTAAAVKNVDVIIKGTKPIKQSVKTEEVDLDKKAKELIAAGADPNTIKLMQRQIENRRKLDKRGK